MSTASNVAVLVTFVGIVSTIVYWNIRSAFNRKESVIKEYESKLWNLNTILAKVTENALAFRKQSDNELTSAKENIEETARMCSALAQREADARMAAAAAKKDRDTLEAFNLNVLSKIRTECALLPSVIAWVDVLHEMIDAREAGYLIEKKNPAYKAHEVVKIAKAEARTWRQQALTLKNKVALYEAQAPWLVDSLDYTVDEIIEGLRFLDQEKSDLAQYDDPVEKYITAAEWKTLTQIQRNELAIDRYFEGRQKSAWLAGIVYERYIGYLYEKEGFKVEYRGVNLGVDDLGIDLVCQRNNVFYLIQCKRLSKAKERPVRESTVAQLYGASLVFAHTKGIPFKQVTPAVVTTYMLSDEAKRFAKALKINYREQVPFNRYPCIKCNISRGGERIYHLPFDQQYDATIIDSDKGEKYVMTIAEAEESGFRRAFRWKGN